MEGITYHVEVADQLSTHGNGLLGALNRTIGRRNEGLALSKS